MTVVDSAFKLLTSPDGRIARDAETHVREVTHGRIGCVPTIHELSEYLSGQQEGAFRETRGTGTTNVWSKDHNASGRLGVVWSIDGAPMIKHNENILRTKQRRNVRRTIRDMLRTSRSKKLLEKPDQGRAMECAVAHHSSSHFVRNGDFCSFADWRT